MLTSHFSFGSPLSCGGSLLALVNSVMKSARAWALIACLGRYSISNSLNSMAHWISRPATSGLLIALQNG